MSCTEYKCKVFSCHIIGNRAAGLLSPALISASNAWDPGPFATWKRTRKRKNTFVAKPEMTDESDQSTTH
jgi:hypothetical protein